MNQQGYTQPPLYPDKTGYPPNNPTSNQTCGWKESPGDDFKFQPNGDSVDPEDLQPKNFSFDEASVRKGFLRKVYLILMCQLIVTFGTVAIFLFHQPTLEFSQKHRYLAVVALVITLVIGVAMACCETPRRKFPTNFICLAIFTAAESFLMGTIAGRYKADSVLLAVGITAILCLSLTIFAMQTKYDFTVCGGFVVCSMMCLMIFGIVTIFYRNHIVHTIYASCGALLASFFLIYDTQMMMGGEHKYSVSPEEYIFAALTLYMDVIRIFLFILKLFGKKSD
ncbi:protein lifeguard 1-like [Calliphora vicina]|uniref:protein lifeguard 1-like n=1 Tax=Calliphora vicina TaxID=7373 RepID=UPI00325ADC2D